MGGGGGGKQYDAEYNARIATLMEAEGVRGEEQYQWEKANLRPYEQAQIRANTSLIPGQTALAQDQINSERLRLEHRNATLPGIYNELGQHDVGAAMNTATADMAAAFGARDTENTMAMKGLGIRPTSSAFQANQNDMTKALGVASARTKARTDTKALNLQEKIQGLQI